MLGLCVSSREGVKLFRELAGGGSRPAQLGGVGRRASGAKVGPVAVQSVQDRIAHEGLTSRFPRERYPLDLRPVLV